MKGKFFVGIMVLFAVAAVTVVAAMDRNATRQQGVAYFARPTQVAGQIVFGKTLIVHDDEKMARGEPCTTLYRTKNGKPEELVSFMCKPEERPPIEKFTVKCARNRFNDMTDVLVEYQFAGETEAHVVPER